MSFFSRLRRFRLKTTIKRNIYAFMSLLGVFCTLWWVRGIVDEPRSVKMWFNFFGMVFVTYLWIEGFIGYQKRIRKEREKPDSH